MRSARNVGSPSLPDVIEPRLRDALNHPVRREILRALGIAAVPRDLAAVSRSVLSDACTLPVLGYHAQVLQRAALTESVPGRVSGSPRFALSAGAARPEVLETLQATEAEDRIAGFRARASGAPARSERS